MTNQSSDFRDLLIDIENIRRRGGNFMDMPSGFVFNADEIECLKTIGVEISYDTNKRGLKTLTWDVPNPMAAQPNPINIGMTAKEANDRAKKGAIETIKNVYDEINAAADNGSLSITLKGTFPKLVVYQLIQDGFQVDEQFCPELSLTEISWELENQ